MANFDTDTLTYIKEEHPYSCFYDNSETWTEVKPEHASEIMLFGRKDGFSKTIKLPKKKLITVDWLLNKINTDTISTYKNFSVTFKKILKNKYNKHFNIYPTSYGIGIFLVYNSNKEKEFKEINDLLQEYGIKYKTEYSDANWVFRFKISKEKENLRKINEFCNIK